MLQPREMRSEAMGRNKPKIEGLNKHLFFLPIRGPVGILSKNQIQIRFVKETVQFLPSARIYRPWFGHENQHFREKQPKTLSFIPIRGQRRRYQHVLVEIRWGGSFQMLGLRRGRDQLVLMPKERPY